MDVVVAVNPGSGQGRGAAAGATVTRDLRDGGHRVTELAGKDAEDLRGQVRTALARHPDALVVVGGDGMVQLGVTAVAGTGVPLGIVAVGTGNDVARALGLPVHDPVAASAVVAAGRTRSVDAVRASGTGRGTGTDQWYMGVLGAGFDALVNERANTWTWPRGRARYVLAVLRELPVLRPRKYTLTLDGNEESVEAVLVAVANGPSYGGGMRVCPDARMDDGLLDVLVVEPLSRAAFLRIFPRVFAGTHVTDPRARIVRARTVTVECAAESGRIVGYADGERIGPLPLTCEVVPGAVDVFAV